MLIFTNFIAPSRLCDLRLDYFDLNQGYGGGNIGPISGIDAQSASCDAQKRRNPWFGE